MVINMENNKLFREKSLNKIASPDNLTEYIRVTTPGVWMVLGAIVLLLAGVCIWGIFGRIDTKLDAIVISDSSGIYAVVEDSSATRIEVGDEIRIQGRTYQVSGIGREAVELKSTDSSYLLHLLGKEEGCWVVRLAVSGSYLDGDGNTQSSPLAEGCYEGCVVIESIHPMTFITN